MREIIRIKVNDEIRCVNKFDYIKAKTNQLREFGYSDLTEKEVLQQLNKILKKLKKLSVIGLLIEEDIVIGDYENDNYTKR